MISIKRIHIKNFRSIVDETIELSDFNTFVGKNDSGKSNVLKALNLFFNGQTDSDTGFDFDKDYSKLAKRGAKQAKEIIIEVDVVIPDTYAESGIKTWTKVWRSAGLRSDNKKELFGKRSRAVTYLDRFIYRYIPAVKSKEFFRYLLSQVYLSMTATANNSLSELNERYSERLRNMTSELSDELRTVLHLNSAIQMPQDLYVLFRDLTFSTSDAYVSEIDLNRRGDGIKARHIPSILRYMQNNAEKNKVKNSISSTYIWGFEEPENGVEYMSCFEMADELYESRTDRQILLTTHSPAFYNKHDQNDTTCYYVHKSNKGASKYKIDVDLNTISEEIGFMPLVTPFIIKERNKFLDRVSVLKRQLDDITEKYNQSVGRVVLITEGKTDIKHIKIAFEELGLDENVLSRIDYYEFEERATLGEELPKLLKQLANIPNTNIYIGIFDRDKHIYPVNQYGFAKIRNSVYKFNIPSLSNDERNPEDKICIEHYYSNAEIKVETEHGRLYMGDDFNAFGISNDMNWVFQNFAQNNNITDISIIDRSNSHLQQMTADAQMITKNDYVDYINEHRQDFNFENFRQIYEVICSIISDSTPNED